MAITVNGKRNKFDDLIQQKSDFSVPDDVNQERNKYDDILQESRSSENTSLKSSLFQATKKNPQAESNVQNLSQATGLPSDTVRRNQQEIEQKKNFNLLKSEDIQNKSPLTAKALSTPDFADVAHDDIVNLQGMEWLFSAVPKAFEEGQEQIELGEIGLRQVFGTSTEEDIQRAESLEGRQGVWLGDDGWLSSAAVEATKLLPQLFETAKSSAIGGGAGALTGAVASLVLPPSAPALALTGFSLGARTGAAFTAFQQEAGLAFREFSTGKSFVDENGKRLDSDVARMAALASGGLNAALEVFAFEKLLKLAGGDKIIAALTRGGIKKVLTRPSVVTALGELAKRYVGGIGVEVATEVAQEAITILAGEVAKDLSEGDFKDITSEEFLQREAEVIEKTAQAMTILALPGPSANFTHDIARARRADQNQKVIEALGDSAKASEVRERVPEKYKEFVKSVRENGDVENIHIPVDKFVEYFQGENIDPGDIGKEIPSVGEQMAEAIATGGDIVIPLEDYATFIAPTEHHEGLSKDIRFHSGDFTFNEAAEFRKVSGEKLEETARKVEEESTADKALEESADIVQKQVKEQLQGAGRSTDVAEQESLVIRSFFKTLARRTGQDPEALYKRSGLSIQGATNEELKGSIGEDAAGTIQGEERTFEQGGQTEENKKFFIKSNKEFIADKVKEGFDIQVDGEFVTLFHGTSLSSAKKILKSGEIRNFPFFAFDKKTAERFGRQAIKRGKPEILEVKIALSDLNVTGGNFTANSQVLVKQDDGTFVSKKDKTRTFNQSPVEVSTETDAFKKWSDNSEVIESEDVNDHDFRDGKTVVVKVFHGTTFTFSVFDAKRGNLEGQFGAINYFTSSEQDATDNYAGEGPDLTNRIESRAEQLADEIQDAIDDDGVDAATDHFGEQFFDEDTLEFAKNIVRNELSGGEDQTLELFIKVDNPFVIGENAGWVELVDNEEIISQAMQQVADNEGLTVEEIEENRDDHEEAIDEARWEIESDTPNKLVEAIQTVSDRNGVDTSKLAGEVFDLGEDATPEDIEQLLRSSDDYAFAEDDETGELIGSQLVAEVIEEMGFDSIILRNAETRFSNMGIEPGTAHVHIFDSKKTNIKSVENIGTFDPGNPDIFLQKETDKPPRGSIKFSPGREKAVITLLENADLTTFFHESGHFFLETFQQVAEQTDQQQIKDDWTSILKWLGVENGSQIGNDQHEKWARGFEAYIFEGKSPSPGMAEAFARFREWMVRVYRSIKNLDVNLTPEVRGVMDRMLATDEEIETAQRVGEFQTLWKTAEEAGVTQKEFDTYRKNARKSADKSNKDLLNRANKVITRERTKAFKEDKKKKQEEITKEVADRPVYQALDFLTSGASTQNVTFNLTDDLTTILNFIHAGVSEGVAGSRVSLENDGQGGTGEVVGIPSSFPEFFKNKGLGKEETLRIIDKVLEGKGVTVRQSKILNDLIEGAVEEFSELERTAGIEESLSRFELPEAFTHEKLSRAAMLDIYGKEFVSEMPKGTVATGEGGLHPDVVGDMFGFSSGDEMIRMIKEASPIKEVIDKETDQAMKDESGDILSDGSIQEEALDAVMSDSRGDVLAAELRILEKSVEKEVKTSRRRDRVSAAEARKVNKTADSQLARSVAKRAIGQKRVRDLRPGQYQAAALNASRKTIEAVAKRDFIEAANLKRQQLISHFMYIESRNAKEELEASQKFFRKFDKANIRELIPSDYVDQIHGILERFEFRKIPLKQVDRRKALSQWVSQQEAQGQEVVIDQQLLNDAFKKSFKDMTVDEVRGLKDTIKNIEHLGRLKGKLISSEKLRNFDKVVDGIVSSIFANNKKIKKSQNYSPDLKEKIKRNLSEIHAEHTKMEFLFNKLDGWQELGPVWTELFKLVADAETSEQDMMEPIIKGMREIFSKYTKSERSKWQTNKIEIKELGISFTKSEIISIALNMGNEGNRTALLEGFKWNEDQAQSAVKSLTKKDWETVQEIWDLVDTLWPIITKLQKDLTGVVPDKVESVSVQTEFGNFKGGYYPLKFDGEHSYIAFQRDEKAATQDLLETTWLKPSTKHGHTINRVGSAGQRVKLSLGVLTEHMTNVVHDIAHRKAILDVDHIIQDERFRTAIEQTAGKEMYRQLRPWLQAIANDRKDPSSMWERIIGRARVGATVVNMGWKITTAIVQPIGFLQTIDVLGVKYSMIGLTKYFASLARSPWDFLKAKNDFAFDRSTALKNRAKNFDRDIRDSLKNNLSTDPNFHQIRQSFFYLTGMLDMVVAVPTWLGAYQKGMDELFQGDEEKSIDFADSIVRKSQSAGGVKDLAAIQRGSELRRMFTMFYSYFSALYNLFSDRIGQKRAGKINVPQFAASMFLLWFLPTVLSELVAGRGPDDDEEYPEWAAKHLISYPFQAVVGLRDIAQGVIGDFGYGFTPVVDVFKTSVRASKSLADGEIDRKNIKDVLITTGYWAQLPSRQVWITGEALYDWSTGEDDIEARDLFFPRRRK